MDCARHVIGCRLTQEETRVQDAFDDLASTSHVIGCRLTRGTRVQDAFGNLASTIHQTLESGDGAVETAAAGTGASDGQDTAGRDKTSTRPLFSSTSCQVCGLVTSSKLEFGGLAKSQMTLGETYQTPTYYG
jgi:hypothetical protein